MFALQARVCLVCFPPPSSKWQIVNCIEPAQGFSTADSDSNYHQHVISAPRTAPQIIIKGDHSDFSTADTLTSQGNHPGFQHHSKGKSVPHMLYCQLCPIL